MPAQAIALEDWTVELFWSNSISVGVALVASVVALFGLHQQERRLGRFISHRLGWRGMLITAWLGVPLHELSHLVVAKLFGHRIIDWKLFQPDPVTGTLGFVRHSYNRDKAWQIIGCFFVGLAPVVVGGSVLALLFLWALPSGLRIPHVEHLPAHLDVQLWWPWTEQILAATRVIVSSVWEGRSAWLAVQLYLGLCVVSHLAPSRADLRNGFVGFFFLLAILTVAIFWLSKLQISLGGALIVPAVLVLLGLGCAIFHAAYALLVIAAIRLTRSKVRQAKVTHRSAN